MKKKLLWISGSLVALALVAFLALQFFLGSIVTAGVNRFGPKITQTTVTLGGAQVSPLSGRGTLTDFVVGNPQGWSAANALSFRKIHIDVAPFSIFGDHIIIENIEIEAPEFTYETKIIASNINDLLKNIEQATGGPRAADPVAKNGKPLKIEVRHFKLTGGTVRLGVAGTGAALPMPTIELHDLGTKEGGLTPSQLSFAVMRQVAPGVVVATAKAAANLGGTSGAAAVEGVKQTAEAIKGLFSPPKK